MAVTFRPAAGQAGDGDGHGAAIAIRDSVLIADGDLDGYDFAYLRAADGRRGIGIREVGTITSITGAGYELRLKARQRK